MEIVWLLSGSIAVCLLLALAQPPLGRNRGSNFTAPTRRAGGLLWHPCFSAKS